MEGLVAFVVYLIVIGVVCYLLWWLIGFIGLPEPFAKVARGAVAVIGVLMLISLLLSLIGHPIIPLKFK